MSQFEAAVDYVLRREGELSENPNDTGGITNYGISLRFVREIASERLRRYGIFEPVTEQTIRDLTIDQAKFIYRGEFWDEAPFQDIEDQALCNYLFDMCINLGVHQGVKLAQRAICAASLDRKLLKSDGILGERTIGYLNSYGNSLLSLLVSNRAAFYRLIAEMYPKQKTNLDGWLNRAYNV